MALALDESRAGGLGTPQPTARVAKLDRIDRQYYESIRAHAIDSVSFYKRTIAAAEAEREPKLRPMIEGLKRLLAKYEDELKSLPPERK